MTTTRTLLTTTVALLALTGLAGCQQPTTTTTETQTQVVTAVPYQTTAIATASDTATETATETSTTTTTPVETASETPAESTVTETAVATDTATTTQTTTDTATTTETAPATTESAPATTESAPATETAPATSAASDGAPAGFAYVVAPKSKVRVIMPTGYDRFSADEIKGENRAVMLQKMAELLHRTPESTEPLLQQLDLMGVGQDATVSIVPVPVVPTLSQLRSLESQFGATGFRTAAQNSPLGPGVLATYRMGPQGNNLYQSNWFGKTPSGAVNIVVTSDSEAKAAALSKKIIDTLQAA